MIKDFNLLETVTVFLAVRRKDVKEYNGNTFVSFEFGDASGRIAGVWWEPERFALEELEEGDVVKVKGTVAEYRGKMQLKVVKLRMAKEEEYKLSDLLPHSKFTKDELKARILSLTERVENSYIRKLLDSFWTDEEFLNEYLKASGGKLWHHAFDMGKMYQYKITSFIDYSDEGRLIGHISMADSIISERAGRIDSFPPALLMKLRHLILSHHGQIEFASPVVPQIPEAFVLYYVDELDAKMGAVDRIREKTGGSGWSDYVNLIQRKLYFGEDK